MSTPEHRERTVIRTTSSSSSTVIAPGPGRFAPSFLSFHLSCRSSPRRIGFKHDGVGFLVYHAPIGRRRGRGGKRFRVRSLHVRNDAVHPACW